MQSTQKKKKEKKKIHQKRRTYSVAFLDQELGEIRPILLRQENKQGGGQCVGVRACDCACVLGGVRTHRDPK